MTISQRKQHIERAQQLLEKALGEPTDTRRALEKLSAVLMRRVVEDVAANDN